MALFDLHATAGSDSPPATSPQMGRYRTYGVFYERYWSRLFGVTRADLDLLVDLITSYAQASGQASDLTSMVRAVIAARLSQGPRLGSTPAPDSKVADPLVRRWDSESSWAVGDRAIFVVPDLDRTRGFAPWLGDIVQVGSDHVLARIDGRGTPEVCVLGPTVRGQAEPSPESRMGALAESGDAGSCVDEVIWRFGSVVVGRLLGALKADTRFAELDGLWFLCELSRRPRDHELSAAARALFQLQTPSLTLDGILARVSPGVQVSAADRFGWALALEERPDTFVRISILPQSRWALAGPPPMPLMARHTAFDPESYAILCTPGDALSPAVARRLWECGLLHAALGMGDLTVKEPEPPQAAIPQAITEPKVARPRVTWWRWLSLSRR